MAFLDAGLLFLLAGGAVALLLRRHVTAASVVGAGTAVIGAVLAMVPFAQVLTSGEPLAAIWPWGLSVGSGAVGVDALSAWFGLVIASIGALAAWYGAGYLRHGHDAHRAPATWASYNLLIVAMLGVVVARDGFLFLIAWEVMTWASFLLVVFDHADANVRRAGWIYLVAAHIGTACLLVMFALLAGPGGHLDFASFGPVLVPGLVFVLALVGFGTKAGFLPLHVWLPEAHSAAPSHVSALLSGVLLKTGIYGLVRIWTFLPTPQVSWGVTLVIIGAVSALSGVLWALAQHDLKRLLAWHSVENLGIIALGLGMGLLGMALSRPWVAFFGFAGALVHVLNHAVFKSLLFMGAGAVIRATGTREIDLLGGLLQRMPRVAWPFLTGATAITGLPPLNGFVSEFLIFLSAFASLTNAAPMPLLLSAVLTIAALALVGGLASACFAKVFGVVFLGAPRSPQAADATRPGHLLYGPMMVLASACIVLGLGAPWVLQAVTPAVEVLLTPAGMALPEARWFGWPLVDLLTMITVTFAAILLLSATIFAVLTWRRRRHVCGKAPTWGCGYVAPAASMQYTASSFAQPLLDVFAPVLGTRTHRTPVEGVFPSAGALESHTDDRFLERMWTPLFTGVARLIRPLHSLQSGRLQHYVLYLVLTLIGLLIWQTVG